MFKIKKERCFIENYYRNTTANSQSIIDELHSLEDDVVKIKLTHKSPKIYEVQCRAEMQYGDYVFFEEDTVKLKMHKGDTLYSSEIHMVEQAVNNVKAFVAQDKKLLSNIEEIKQLPYVKSVSPYSHWFANTYPLHNLKFRVSFEDYIHSKYIKEPIGEIFELANNLSISNINETYTKIKENALASLENEFVKHALKNDKTYQEVISYLQDLCKNTDYLKINVSDNYDAITLLNNRHCILRYEYSNKDELGKFETKVKQDFINAIQIQIENHNKVGELINLINSCNNRMWTVRDFVGSDAILCLCEPANHSIIVRKQISLCNSENIKEDILTEMESLLNYAENYYGIRYMEDKKIIGK